MITSIYKTILAFIHRFNDHDITGSAAKATYYLLLSFFPLCLILIALLQNTQILDYILPPSVAVLLDDIATPAAAFQTSSVVIILWSASSSVWALMTGIHAAYTGERKIKLLYGKFRSILLIFILVIDFVACSILTFVSNALIDWFLGDFSHQWLLQCLRCAILILWVFITLISLYKFTPTIKVKVKEIYIGALLTSIGWALATWGFEIYMQYFNKYSALYGSIGTFLGLTLWLYIISIILFSGAEINVMLSERNPHFIKKDTT